METWDATEFSDDGEGIDDAFEMREAIGETGIDEFAQTIGQAIGEQLQAQQAPQAPTEEDQVTAHAQAIVARNPGLQTQDGALGTFALAEHVANAMGAPDLVRDLGFIEAVHVAAQGARAGVDQRQGLTAQSIVGGRSGRAALPF